MRVMQHDIEVLKLPDLHHQIFLGGGAFRAVPPLRLSIMPVGLFTIVLALTLAACEKKEVASQGPPGPTGPPGPAGPPGGTVIRFVDGECHQTCTVACEANERILNTEENRATFLPQRQGASAKVVLACARK